jgi:hypothetical protein
MKVLTITFILILIACAEKKEQKVAAAKETQEKAVEINDPFMKQYFTLQDKLARDKFEGNSEIIEMMQKELVNVVSDQKESFEAVLSDFAATETIEEQRTLFKTLSDLSYDYVKANNLDTDIYLMHCPMAFNNKGGSWLQSDKYLLNPYYGSRMLRCGKVTETIAKK